MNIEGEDLTSLPLLEHKRRLARLMPTIDCSCWTAMPQRPREAARSVRVLTSRMLVTVIRWAMSGNQIRSHEGPQVFMKAVNAQIAFIVDGSGNATRIAFHYVDMDFTARKVR